MVIFDFLTLVFIPNIIVIYIITIRDLARVDEKLR